jgi:hypothetical protein
MDLSLLFLNFLYRIALGAGAVFALLLVIRFGIPQRTMGVINRKNRR